MKIAVKLLQPEMHEDYNRLLRSVDYSLVYSSLPFRRFLTSLLPGCKSRYLCAYQGESMVGALPAFLACHEELGNVLNSLPFFGSNGGVVVSPDADDPLQVKRELMHAFDELAREQRVVSSTIISNPLHPDPDFYERFSAATLHDDRIGQITQLPNLEPKETLGERLLGQFHRKTRNHIRKAEKSGLSIERTGSKTAFDVLEKLHRAGMEAIGGRAKSTQVFDSLHGELAFGDDYTLYLAERDGRVAAALLVLFFHRTADYFVPATDVEYRVFQPMSLLVFEAMQDAIRRGCRYWNWGGTWLSQKGVYDFKSRWGTTDYPYRYYVREYDGANRLRRCSAQRLLAEYPNFYVLPFHVLEETPSDSPT